VNGSRNGDQHSALPDELERAAILRQSKGGQSIENAALDQTAVLDKMLHPTHFILQAERFIVASHQIPERRQFTSSAAAVEGTDYVDLR
jgi:hypothetical protein